MSLPTLPPGLRHELQLLPSRTGFPLLHQSIYQSSTLPDASTFLLLDTPGRSLAGSSLQVEGVQRHTFASLPFVEILVKGGSEEGQPIVLFLCPVHHLSTCQALCRSDTTYLVVYDVPSYAPLERFTLAWGEPYQQELQRLVRAFSEAEVPVLLRTNSRESKAARSTWHQFLAQWKRAPIDRLETTILPVSPSVATPLDASPLTEAPALQVPATLQLPTEVLRAAQEMLEEKRTRNAEASGIRWHLTSSGMVEGVVLFPSEGAWWQTTLVFHPPMIHTYDEGALLALPYDFQGLGIAQVEQHALFIPGHRQDQRILDLLSRQNSLTVHGVVSYHDRGQIVGTKRYPFLSNKQRRLLKQTSWRLGKDVPASPDRILERYWVEREQENQKKERTRKEQRRWHLPLNWNETLRASLQQAALLLSTEADRPLLLISLPAGTDAEGLRVEIPALNMFRYASGYLAVCLHIDVITPHGEILPIDLLIHPLQERKRLRKLASAKELTVLLLEHLGQRHWSVSGARIVPWPEVFRSRLLPLTEQHYRHYRIHTPENKVRWQALLREHGALFPPTTQFHSPAQLPHRIRENLPLWNTSWTSLARSSSSSDIQPQDINAEVGGQVNKALGHERDIPLQETPPLELLGRSLLARILWNEYQHLPTPRKEIAWDRQAFWRSFAYFALRQAAPFSWEGEALELMPETALLQAVPDTSPSLVLPPVPPRFPRLHLWIQFPQAVTTVIGPIHGLAVVAAHDDGVFETLATYYALSPAEKRQLHKTVYQEERHRLIITLYGADGTLLWGMSLPSHRSVKSPSGWFAPPWARCPDQACRFEPQLSADKKTVSFRYVPCPRCGHMQFALASWLVAAWYGLQGAYRQAPLNENESAFALSEDFTEEILLPDKGTGEQLPLRPYRFHIIRHFDLLTPPPKKASTPSQRKRGSWIERRLQEDTASVVREKRLIQPRRRTLSHQRFEPYRRQHGTDKLEVSKYIKQIPMLREGITDVSAQPLSPENDLSGSEET